MMVVCSSPSRHLPQSLGSYKHRAPPSRRQFPSSLCPRPHGEHMMCGQALRAPGCWELGGGGAESSLCLGCQGRCWMQAWAWPWLWPDAHKPQACMHGSQSTQPCLSPPRSCWKTTVAFLICSNVCIHLTFLKGGLSFKR